VALGIGIALYLAVPLIAATWPLPHNKDWLDAVAAFGSAIGALATFVATGVALYFSLSQQRKANNDAMERARLVASRIAGPLTRSQAKLRELNARLGFYNDDEQVNDPMYDIVAMYVAPEEFAFDIETLSALVPLPNRCAHRIAKAADLIASIRDSVKQARTECFTWAKAARGVRLGHIEAWRETARSAERLLQGAVEQCLVASATGAPMPTDEELYGSEDFSDWR
jgi:hypothetical protein